MTWCTAPRRAYPPRSSRRARARPRAATWAPSSEERWCPSSTAPSSARRPRSAACHTRGVCMVYVPLRGRAESPTPQPLTDCSPSTRAGLAPSADPSKRSLGTTSCRLSSGQRRARDPGMRGRLGWMCAPTCLCDFLVLLFVHVRTNFSQKTQHIHKFSISYITRYTAHAQLNSHNQQRNVRPQQGAGPSPCTTGGGTINRHVATGTWPTRQRPMRRPQAPASHHDTPRKAVAHATRQRSMAARTVSKRGSDRSLPLVLLSTCWTSWPPVAVVS